MGGRTLYPPHFASPSMLSSQFDRTGCPMAHALGARGITANWAEFAYVAKGAVLANGGGAYEVWAARGGEAKKAGLYCSGMEPA